MKKRYWQILISFAQYFEALRKSIVSNILKSNRMINLLTFHSNGLLWVMDIIQHPSGALHLYWPSPAPPIGGVVMVEETRGVFGVSGVVAPTVDEDVLRIVRNVRWSLADDVSVLMIIPPEGDGFVILAIGESSWVGSRGLKINTEMLTIGEPIWRTQWRRTSECPGEFGRQIYLWVSFTFQSLVWDEFYLSNFGLREFYLSVFGLRGVLPFKLWFEWVLPFSLWLDWVLPFSL